jgi:hypothetical protein
MSRRKKMRTAELPADREQVEIPRLPMTFMEKIRSAMKTLIGTIAGLAMIGGAIYSFHVLQIDGFVACILGGAGIGLVYHAITGSSNW